MKTQITDISAVGIICRACNPSQIFVEIRYDCHPIKLMRRQLCLIGGNWIGEAAKNDMNPFATFRRGLNEELSFEEPIRNTEKLTLIGMTEAETSVPTPSKKTEATQVDKCVLNQLRDVIADSATPFGDFLSTVQSTMDAADPANTRDGFTSLASYWTVYLDEIRWEKLCALQKKFGNLSNKSVTMITSLEEIVRTNTEMAFPHDRVLQAFWRKSGFHMAEQLPLVPGIESVAAGMPFDNYEEYLELFEISKNPL